MTFIPSQQAALMDNILSAGLKAPLARVSTLLQHKNLTLGTAESCTGGLIASVCTSLSGSSAWFKGGIVAYDNSVKTALLKVDAEILAKEGAVSGPVVEAMARGAADALNVDCAIAVSGVAGPDGGTENKPVGTIWVGTFVKGHKYEVKSQMHHFQGSRTVVRLATVEEGLLSLIRHLER